MRRIGVHGAGMTSISSMVNGAVGGVVVENPWWDPNGDGLCIWSAYAAKGAASLAASYTDLTGNGNNAGVGVAPTWDGVNGWIFNGVDQYLTTTFVPQADQSQSMIVQFTNLTTAQVLCGLQSDTNSSDYLMLRGDKGTNEVLYRNGSAAVVVAPSFLAGNLCVAGNAGYRNGAAEGGAIAAWAGAAPTTTVFIGAMQDNTGPAVNFDAYYCQAFALYDCTLTAPQVAAVQTAMAAL